MSFTKPDELPKFADEDLTDDITGQSNTLAPTSDQGKWGWYPYRKKPGRRVTNWLHRMYYRWIAWLDQALTALDERVTDLENPTTYSLKKVASWEQYQPTPAVGVLTEYDASLGLPDVVVIWYRVNGIQGEALVKTSCTAKSWFIRNDWGDFIQINFQESIQADVLHIDMYKLVN